jgi:hypothetical protein
MTTEAASPPSRPRKRPGPLPVAAATLATFLVLVTLLAMQLRSGRDPALGAGPGASAAQAAPKRVLVKRIVRRKVIVRLIPSETSGGAPVAAGGAAAPATAGAGAAPVTSAPAPAAAAPAAAPAPAAPAPVTASS